MAMLKSPIERACDLAGGQAALARLLCVHPSLPHQWVKGHRPIPAERCPDIERVSAGKVRCEELRPDVDWAYLRGSEKVGAGEVATALTPETLQRQAA